MPAVFAQLKKTDSVLPHGRQPENFFSAYWCDKQNQARCDIFFFIESTLKTFLGHIRKKNVQKYIFLN